MKNGNEARDLLGNSRERSRTRPRIAIENPDFTKNQSDSRIRYRALREKNQPITSLPPKEVMHSMITFAK